MDRRDQDPDRAFRESSSLPESLIPYLVSAPATALEQTTESRSCPAFSAEIRYPPIYSDPQFHSVSSLPSRSFDYQRPDSSLWREGEPGPSSLHRLISPNATQSARRSSSQPPRMAPDPFGRPNAAFERDASFTDLRRPSADSPVFFNLPNTSSFPNPYHSNDPPSHTYRHQPLPSSSQLLTQSHALLPTASFDRYETYYPSLSSLSLSTPTTYRNAETHESSYRSESPQADKVSSNGVSDADEPGTRKRRNNSPEDAAPTKSRNPKKTAVACNFCRARKLRCDGVRPTCNNCQLRTMDCEYVAHQRRRGPGRAPRGSRTRRGPTSGLDLHTSTTPDGPPLPEYELDALDPEVRQFTSVMTLDSFAFEPPTAAPQYPGSSSSQGRNPSISMPRIKRSRFRSRETSSEDQSEAEREWP